MPKIGPNVPVAPAPKPAAKVAAPVKPAPAKTPTPAPKPAAPAPAKVVAAAGKAPAPKPVATPPKAAPPARPAQKPQAAKTQSASGVKGDVASILADMEETWEGAEEKGNSFERLPEGKYQCRIDNTEVGPAKTSGRLQATWHLTVAGGEFINRKLWKHDGLDDSESIGWFKGGLKRLGIEPPQKPTEIPGVMESLRGTFCLVAVKHREGSDFVNVYFQNALDSNEIDTEGLAEVAAEGDAEAPFDATSWSVGDACQSQFGDDWYSGKITSIKGAKAKVLFEDGETLEMDLAVLHPFNQDEPAEGIEPDEATEAEAGEGEAGEGEGEGEEAEAEAEGGAEVEVAEASCNLTFAEPNVPGVQKDLHALGVKFGFKPDDYQTWLGLCQEMAEYAGLQGDITTVQELIKKLKAVKV